MKPSLREILAESHVAAVTIVALLFWSLDWGFRGLWDPFLRVADFVITAVAILGIPYFSKTLTVVDRLLLIETFYYLFSAFACVAAAWLLSRWVYGVGPLRSLSKYYSRLIGRAHV